MRRLRAWWLRLTVRGSCPVCEPPEPALVAVLYNDRPARRCPNCGLIYDWRS